MTRANERTQAAARVITEHRVVRLPLDPVSKDRRCTCGQVWSPAHVAMELDKAGLLCALVKP